SAENLAPQGYFPADLGLPKVLTTGGLCRHIHPEIILKERRQRFLRQTGLPKDEGWKIVIFCTVDSISTRKTIWESWQDRVDLFLDGRLNSEMIRGLTQQQRREHTLYRDSLFGEHEAYQGACTSKSTIYTAATAAGLLLAQLARGPRGLYSMWHKS